MHYTYTCENDQSNSSLVMGGRVVFLLAELEGAEPVLPVSESISPVRRLPVNKVSNKTYTLYKCMLETLVCN